MPRRLLETVLVLCGASVLQACGPPDCPEPRLVRVPSGAYVSDDSTRIEIDRDANLVTIRYSVGGGEVEEIWRIEAAHLP